MPISFETFIDFSYPRRLRLLSIMAKQREYVANAGKGNNVSSIADYKDANASKL